MRAGWNERLAERLQRPDPAAREIVEGVIEIDRDVRRLQEDWSAATVQSGDVVRDVDGGVRLRSTVDQWISNETSTGYETRFNPGYGLRAVAQLVFESGNPAREISSVSVQVVAQQSPGDDQEVKRWKASLYRLVSYSGSMANVVDGYLELQRIAPPVIVDDPGGGTAPATLEFDFTDGGRAPALGVDPEKRETSAAGYDSPTVFLMLEALDKDGAQAGNAGWAHDFSQSNIFIEGVTLSSMMLALEDAGGPNAGLYFTTTGAAVPCIRVFGSSYTAPATIGFVGSHNRISLPALTPESEIELVAQGETPAGSSIEYSVSADGVTWVGYRDGDRVGEGTLSGLARQPYYYMRATLRPGGLAAVSPVLRAIGATAVRVIDLDGLATVQVSQGGWSIDPITLAGVITEVTISVIRDGERDFRDIATEIVSLYHTAEMGFRVWVGAPELDRADWLHIDSFEIDDYEASAEAIDFYCLSALARLRTALPVPDTSDPENVKREPLVLDALSLSAAYSEILDGEIGFPRRYRGPGVPAGAHAVATRGIEDSDAKAELDAIAFLAGGGLISSQGVVKFADMLGAQPLVLAFERAEIESASSTPGLRQRRPEFFVPYGWDGDRYVSEVQAVHAESLRNVGGLGLDAPPRLDDVIARWIHSDGHADEIGERTVRTFGPGLILWTFRAVYPHPYLEPGDRVVVPTETFVAKDPTSGRILAGVLWAEGVIQSVGDVLGREFVVWVRSYADIFPEIHSVDRAKIKAKPEAYSIKAKVQKVLPDKLRYLLTGGELISYAVIYEQVAEVGEEDDDVTLPEPGERAGDYNTPSALPAEVEVPYAPLGFVRWIRIYGLTADFEGGEYVDIPIPHLPPEAPIASVETHETTIDGTAVGVFRITLRERGIAVTGVEVQTQVGDEPRSPVRAPFRGPGDVSLIDGAVLTAEQVEHHIIQHASRLSQPHARALLETGEVMEISVPPFDRNRLPDIGYLDVIDQKVKCSGDSDTKSWHAYRKDVAVGDPGYWAEEKDGHFVTFEPPVPDGETWSIEFVARSDHTASVGPATLTTSQSRMVRGAGVDVGTSPRLILVAVAPPADGSAMASVSFQPQNLPPDVSGWGYKVFARQDKGSGFGGWSEITGALMPHPGQPVEDVITTCDWLSDPVRNDSGSLSVLWEVRVELWDAGKMLDSNADTSGWPYSSGSGGGREIIPIE